MIDFYVSLSSGMKSSLIITLFLIIGLVLIGSKVKKLDASASPTGIVLIAVVFVEGINNILHGLFEKHWHTFAPYMMTVLLYLLFANTVSLFGLTPPMANISVALSFSIFAFVSIQVAALLIKKPIQRGKDLLDPNPLFLPINLIGEFSTPFAMGLRLFGNLLSGSIIAIIIYGLSHSFGLFVYNVLGSGALGAIGYTLSQVFGVGFGAVVLHPIFDIFFGAIQAYVYFMLLSIFMSMAVED